MGSPGTHRKRRLGVLLLAALVALAMAGPSRAAQVVLRVDGLACPFCAFGLEKKLRRVPSIDDMDIRLNGGKVILRLREGKRLDLPALDRAVNDAGFTLRKVLVEGALGTLSRSSEGEWLLRASDPPALFRLRLAGDETATSAAALRESARVRVTGEVTEFVPEPATLEVRSLELADSEAGEQR